MIYIFIYLLFLVLSTIELYNGKLKYISYFICLFILIALGALRWETGTDWLSYRNFFLLNDSLDSYLKAGFEVGFSYLNFFVKSITDDYTIMLFVLTSLSLFFKSIFVLKRVNNVVFVLFGFYCFFLGDIFAVRQSIAIGILLSSTIFIIEKRFFLFLIFVVFSSTIHVTSVFFILAYPIFYLKWSNRKLLWILVGAIIFGFFRLPIVLLSKLGSIGDLGIITSKLTFYLEEGSPQNTLDNPVAVGVSLIRRMLIFTPLFLCRKRCESSNYEYNGYLNLFCFGNVIFFAFFTSVEAFIRMAAYFYIYEILLLAIILKVYWPTKAGSWVYLLILMYFAIKLYGALSAYWDLYIPYYSVFEYVPRISY